MPGHQEQNCMQTCCNIMSSPTRASSPEKYNPPFPFFLFLTHSHTSHAINVCVSVCYLNCILLPSPPPPLSASFTTDTTSPMDAYPHYVLFLTCFNPSLLAVSATVPSFPPPLPSCFQPVRLYPFSYRVLGLNTGFKKKSLTIVSKFLMFLIYQEVFFYQGKRTIL